MHFGKSAPPRYDHLWATALIVKGGLGGSLLFVNVSGLSTDSPSSIE